MVFVKTLNKNVDVIDGQQRLTATSILIAVIGDMLEDAGKHATADGYYRVIATEENNLWNPKITPNTKYQKFYNNLLQLDGTAIKYALGARSNRAIEKNMLKAYKIFHDKLKEQFVDTAGQLDTGALQDFYNDFMDPAKFTLLQITVPNNIAAWQVFINLNKKGQDLQISTLVKAIILSTIPDGTEREIATGTWADMEQELEGIKFDQFLHHYFVADVKSVQEKDLYEVVSTDYKDKLTETRQLLNDISEAAKDYRACVAPMASDYSDKEIEDNLKALKSPLGLVHAYSILLAGYTKDFRPGSTSGVKKFRNLVEWVLKYFIRERTICGEEPAKLEKFAAKICKMIREGKGPSDIKNEFISNQTNDSLFKESFKEKSKSSIGRDFYILSKINAWGYNDVRRDLTDIAYKNKSVEHIMPQTPKPDWIIDLKKDPSLEKASEDRVKEQHKSYLNKWGNLTPMHRENNTALLNKIFHEKNNHPKGYKQSNAKINNQIEKYAQSDSSYPEPWWDIRSVINRTEALADHAERIFKVT